MQSIQVEKKGVVEKLQTLQETCLQVQESMDVVASLFERVEKLVSNRIIMNTVSTSRRRAWFVDSLMSPTLQLEHGTRRR